MFKFGIFALIVSESGSRNPIMWPSSYRERDNCNAYKSGPLPCGNRKKSGKFLISHSGNLGSDRDFCFDLMVGKWWRNIRFVASRWWLTNLGRSNQICARLQCQSRLCHCPFHKWPRIARSWCRPVIKSFNWSSVPSRPSVLAYDDHYQLIQLHTNPFFMEGF